MKALTIKQPYAAAIAQGLKGIEYRSWPTKYRGRLLIHAGKATDIWKSWGPFRWQREFPGLRVEPADIVFSAIVAAATLTDCRFNDENEDYEWVLEEVRPLAEPIACAGTLGLWNFPDDRLPSFLQTK